MQPGDPPIPDAGSKHSGPWLWDGPATEPLAVLRRTLEPYDRFALLSAFAGAMTIPANASFGLRFSVLAEIAASLPSVTGLPIPTAHRIHSLVMDANLIGMIGPMEDPAEYPVTEPIAFMGRVYACFTGQGEEKAYRSERLFEVFEILNRTSRGSWTDRACGLIAAGLELSNATVRRRGLRSAEPVAQSTDPVSTPASAAAVAWNADQWAAVMAAAGQPDDVLDTITMRAGEGIADAQPDFGALVRRPIVRFPDGRRVLVPDHLLDALTLALLTEANTAGALKLVAEAYSEAVAASVEEMLLRVLDAGVDERFPHPPTILPCAHDAAFLAGDDVLMLVEVLGDPLDQFDLDAVRGEWKVGRDYSEELTRHLGSLVDWALTVRKPGQEILVLVCASAPAGRGFQLGYKFQRPEAEFLAIGPAALGVIAFTEVGEPRALLRFAKSRRRLQESMEVLAWNPLDEYEVYDSHGQSFYLDDDHRFDLVSFGSDFGLRLRQQTLDRLDRQSAVFPLNGRHIELFARYEGEGAPIYFPRERLPGACFLVRHTSLDLWIVGPRWSDMPAASSPTCQDILDMVTFWAWQIAPSVVALTGASGDDEKTLTVNVQIEDLAAWFTDPGDATDASLIVVPESDNVARVAFFPGFATALMRPDNAGERWLVAELTGVLCRLLGQAPSTDQVKVVVEEVAPLGQRKMFIVMPGGNDLRIGSPDGLPGWRRVSKWDSAVVLDEVADELATRDHEPGPAGDIRAQSGLINEAVAIMYDRLKADASTLSSDGLVEELLLRQEALLRETALREIQIPTRVACFGPYSDIASRLRLESKDLTIASIAHRFLVEFMATQPPSGMLRLSDGRYDRLLALAATIVDYGFQSDVTYEGLSETNARILPSGRLGTRPGEFGEATESHAKRAIPEQIRTAQDEFANRWREAPAGADLPTGWEDAFRAEFGYSFSELTAVLRELVGMTNEPSRSIVTAARTDVIASIASTLSFSPEAIDRVLDDLTLAARSDYLAPSPPFEKQDVWPWRFNRPLSLLRRPIIRRQTASRDELIWGYRGLALAGVYLMNLIFNGQLVATSGAMKDLQSKLTKKASDAFVEEVAAAARGIGLEARTQVSKFGRVRIEAAGQPLGDIDVLAIDRARPTLWLIECKNLVLAKTPHELASEIEGFEAPGGMIEKHGRRVQWVTANLDLVLSTLGLGPVKWRVVPLIAVRTDLVSLHLRPMAIPAVPLRDLTDVLVAGQIPTSTSARHPHGPGPALGGQHG